VFPSGVFVCVEGIKRRYYFTTSKICVVASTHFLFLLDFDRRDVLRGVVCQSAA